MALISSPFLVSLVLQAILAVLVSLVLLTVLPLLTVLISKKLETLEPRE